MLFNNVHPKMLKNTVHKYIHVFTDNKDFYINVENDNWQEAKQKAIGIKNDWIKDGHKNIRIYQIHEEQDHRDGEMYQVSEDCLFSMGVFPS